MHAPSERGTWTAVDVDEPIPRLLYRNRRRVSGCYALGFASVLASLLGVVILRKAIIRSQNIHRDSLDIHTLPTQSSSRWAQKINSHERLGHINHLIVVAGHSVYIGHDFSASDQQESWYLESYQQIPGQVESILEHIRLGVELAADDKSSVLMFSGGHTRKAAGPRSESSSYWYVAQARQWFGHPSVENRAFTEDHSRDSFENLLFSVCRFREVVGVYPEKVTVVSYQTKEDRFVEFHRAALQFPREAFYFIGTSNLMGPQALTGEEKTIDAFQHDPFGCHGALMKKRMERDPFNFGSPSSTRCPELGNLLEFLLGLQKLGKEGKDSTKSFLPTPF
ncbi:hypothetical protein BSKO_04079 [Bryopsis sp. KO-2023]|nr:hypothetical protein BSKO_04079 [Bryopsis sp. KO-2023]